MKKLNERFAGQKFRIPALLLVVALILSVTSGVVFARYVLKEDHSGMAEAKSFYFESNYLKEGGAEYTVYIGSVDVNVTNGDGLNITPEDITYTITDVDAETDVVQTLTGNIQSTNDYTISGNDGDKKEVTATSLSPYAKTLSATFNFKNPGENTVYKAEDQGYFITIDIYTGIAAEDITVNYGEGLAPDNTNEKMEKWTSGTSGILSGLSPNAHYSFIFFKNQNVTITTEQKILGSDNTITITESN